jgi:hypothetical protein
MRSFVARTKIANSLAPASYAASSNGTTVDLLGFDSNVLEIVTGALTSATAQVQDSPDGVTFTAVADASLDGITGNPAGFALTAATVQQIGYIGDKRYLRVSLTAAAAALVSASVIRTDPKQVP